MPDPEPGSSPRLLAVLGALEELLGNYATSGERGDLDIGRSPLTSEERRALEVFLGLGEVEARIDALGVTLVRETSVGAVWWVRHYDGASRLVAEFIEVTDIPELLKAPPEGLSAGLEKVRAQLAR